MLIIDHTSILAIVERQSFGSFVYLHRHHRSRFVVLSGCCISFEIAALVYRSSPPVISSSKAKDRSSSSSKPVLFASATIYSAVIAEGRSARTLIPSLGNGGSLDHFSHLRMQLCCVSTFRKIGDSRLKADVESVRVEFFQARGRMCL